MPSFFQDQRALLQDFSVQDLSRTLVRQYLYQHDMFKTLNCFENEDKKNSKKIVRSLLIKMLSMNNLVVNNKKKQKQNQSKSLLMILVQYLRDKFQQRINRQNQQYNKNAFQKNKQLSMNGDEYASTKNQSNKKANNKNLANSISNKSKMTQKSSINEKTLTQEAFYKKKDSIKNDDNSRLKKQKTFKDNEKNITGNRPSTAKPSLNYRPSKQQQKISVLYSKLNSNQMKNNNFNNKNNNHQKYVSKDVYAEKKDFSNEQKQQSQKQGQKTIIQYTQSPLLLNKVKIIGSSAINRSSRQSTSKSQMDDKKRYQKSQLQNLTTKLDERQNMSQSKVNAKQQQKKVNTFFQNKIQIKKKGNQQPDIIIDKKEQNYHKNQKIDLGQNSNNEYKILNNQKKNEVMQQYYEQFQQQVKVTKPYQDKIQVEIVSSQQKDTKQKANQMKVQLNTKKNISKQKIQSEAAQLKSSVQNYLNQIPKQNKQFQNEQKNGHPQKQPLKQIQILQQKIQNHATKQQLYKPSQASGPRVMKKLLRKTGKQLSKQQDATEMIGNNIKILSNQADPLDNKRNQNLQIDQLVKKPSEIKIQQTKQQTLIQKQSPKLVNDNSLALQNSNVQKKGKGNMVMLKKKAKNNQEQQKQQSSKFKFDDNFVDQPLNGNKQKYSYQKFSFQKMIIKPELKPKKSNFFLQKNINYEIKPTTSVQNNILKKKNQKAFSFQRSQQLKKIMFQKGSPYLAKAWHQGFILSSFKQTFFGLKQIQGGPCGIIAAVQCYFLKHLMYLSNPKSQDDLKSQIRRQNCLVAALTDILWKSKGGNQKIILSIPANKNFSGAKLQISNLVQVQIQATSFQYVYQNIWQYKSSFIGQANHGVTLLIYSIVLTKGIQNIYNQVDMRQNPLIGHHGHCTQELVNLFISGQASSNCFDGKKQLQEGFTLHGIQQKSQFGFLTVFQTLEYIQVGKNLKNPLFPIWIISKQFHYHVTFGNHYLISENNDCEKFDLVYFDGLYTCDKFIRLTFDKMEKDEFGIIKQTGNKKNLPLIEQVLLKKWGQRQVDWNGSIKIL